MIDTITLDGPFSAWPTLAPGPPLPPLAPGPRPLPGRGGDRGRQPKTLKGNILGGASVSSQRGGKEIETNL